MARWAAFVGIKPSLTASDGENRYVSVPSSVLELLKVWKAQQAANCNMLGNKIPAYIATHEDGKLMHSQSTFSQRSPIISPRLAPVAIRSVVMTRHFTGSSSLRSGC